MKSSAVLVALVSVASSSAFAPSAPAPRLSTRLHIAVKGKVGPVRKAIASLTKENFSATLAEIEPFLTQEAGAAIYGKSMRRIATQARGLGVEVPAEYAREAKCTEKRRAKQSAYCDAKTEEAAAAAAAEAEAAAAAAAEAAAADAAEEAAPAEE